MQFSLRLPVQQVFTHSAQSHFYLSKSLFKLFISVACKLQLSGCQQQAVQTFSSIHAYSSWTFLSSIVTCYFV